MEILGFVVKPEELAPLPQPAPETFFQTVKITYSKAEGAPESVSVDTDLFSKPLSHAEACLKSWTLRFDNEDHKFHLGECLVERVELVEDNKKVRVTGKLGIRDDSGDWDDSYSGEMEILVIGISSGT